MAKLRIHGRCLGLQPGQRPLIRRKLAVTNGADVHHGEDLPGFHQHALGVTEQLGVALGGALVKPRDRAGVAGLLPQARDKASAGGAGGEPSQWHRAPDPALRYRILAARHSYLLAASRVSR